MVIHLPHGVRLGRELERASWESQLGLKRKTKVVVEFLGSLSGSPFGRAQNMIPDPFPEFRPSRHYGNSVFGGVLRGLGVARAEVDILDDERDLKSRSFSQPTEEIARQRQVPIEQHCSRLHPHVGIVVDSEPRCRGDCFLARVPTAVSIETETTNYQ
jgi:hypothetical protein